MYKSILVISDTHVPYHHKDLFPFLKEVKKQLNPDKVVHIGDELDKHALSFHDNDPDLPSAGDELRISLPIIKKWRSYFLKLIF
jgi:predicted phosphodiesterase